MMICVMCCEEGDQGNFLCDGCGDALMARIHSLRIGDDKVHIFLQACLLDATPRTLEALWHLIDVSDE